LDKSELREFAKAQSWSFHRYNIISDRRLRASGEKIAAHKAAKAKGPAKGSMVRDAVRDAKTGLN
jgi:hypothetical protein